MPPELDNSLSWSRFSRAIPELVRSSLACLGAGEQVGPIEPFSRRALEYHGLVVVSSGAGTYNAGKRSVERVAAPALIWLYPGVEHGYGPDRAGWSEHWILFGGIGAEIYERTGLVDREHPVVSLTHVPARLEFLFRLLREELGPASALAALRASVIAQDVIASALTATSGRPETSTTLAVVRALESSAFDSLPIADRAAALGLSVNSLRNIVRDATGMTPLDYILEIRLDRARTLLAETTLDVTEIARAVGYDDPAYFSRTFAGRMGIAPSAFRHQQYRRSRSS